MSPTGARRGGEQYARCWLAAKGSAAKRQAPSQHVHADVSTYVHTYVPSVTQAPSQHMHTDVTDANTKHYVSTYAGAQPTRTCMSTGATELARRGLAQLSHGAPGPQGGVLRSRKFVNYVRASGHKRSAPHSHHPGPGAWARGPVLGPVPRGPGPPAPGLGPRPRPQPIPVPTTTCPQQCRFKHVRT